METASSLIQESSRLARKYGHASPIQKSEVSRAYEIIKSKVEWAFTQMALGQSRGLIRVDENSVTWH